MFGSPEPVLPHAIDGERLATSLELVSPVLAIEVPEAVCSALKIPAQAQVSRLTWREWLPQITSYKTVLLWIGPRGEEDQQALGALGRCLPAGTRLWSMHPMGVLVVDRLTGDAVQTLLETEGLVSGVCANTGLGYYARSFARGAESQARSTQDELDAQNPRSQPPEAPEGNDQGDEEVPTPAPSSKAMPDSQDSDECPAAIAKKLAPKPAPKRAPKAKPVPKASAAPAKPSAKQPAKKPLKKQIKQQAKESPQKPPQKPPQKRSQKLSKKKAPKGQAEPASKNVASKKPAAKKVANKKAAPKKSARTVSAKKAAPRKAEPKAAKKASAKQKPAHTRKRK